MRYPLFTYIKDGLEVTMSEPHEEHQEIGVRVYFERWSDAHDAFDSMDIWLPDGKMEHIIGFSPAEVYNYEKMVLDLKQPILESSKEYYAEDCHV